MITIDQLLESVDLDFEPRWVTKDEFGAVWIWNIRPDKNANWSLKQDTPKQFRGHFISDCLKLSEFENKHWTECIYEVPRKDKPVVKIEKLQPTVRGFDEVPSMPTAADFLNKINELVAAVNELKEKNNG